MILLLILSLGAFLRFWNLTKVPPSLYWDEVSQAYNAYSILETGKDEHQERMPFARFQAFGDYKAPVNIYLTVVSIAFFGKNDFSVRFPSAFLGTLSIAFVFLLVKYLFSSVKHKEIIALVASFLLAISPWHIQLSRAAFEGNVATFFTIAALSLFFIAIRKSMWFILPSIFCFVIAFYSFNAHRVFIPLFVIFLAVLYWKNLLEKKKIVVFGIVVGFILLLPFANYFRSPESKLRFNEVNIFTDIGVIQQSNNLNAHNSSLIGKIIDNRRVLYGQSFLKHYFDFFDPRYLFITGDINPRFSDQFNGELYLWVLPLFCFGVYTLYVLRSKEAIFIVAWLFLAPVAAATARETPHALRSETFIPVFEIVASVGAATIFLYFKKKKKIYTALLTGAICVVLFSLYSFLHNYFIHNPKINSYDWQYGYKEVVEYAESIKKDYDRIYFSNIYGRPSIYIAWYGNIKPEEYWKEAHMTKDFVGFFNTSQLGKYYFVNQPPKEISSKTLIIMEPSKIPENVKILKEVDFLNGEPAFIVAKGL